MRTFVQEQKPTPQTKSTTFAKPGRPHLGQSHEVTSILQLQHTIGNQFVQRLLQSNTEEFEAGSATTASTGVAHDISRIPAYPRVPMKVQTKLKVNTPGDAYEQEADRVADQVMFMPEPRLQRACTCGGECPKCMNEKREQAGLQAKPVPGNAAGGFAASPMVDSVLRSPGRTLGATARNFMESRFGHDFSSVRVHTDAQAAESGRSIGARAFTVGNDIVFGDGQYKPHDTEGRRLLAHELTHVVQQRERTAARSAVQRAITLTDPGDTIPHAVGAMGPFPTKAFTLNSWLDTLCPDGNWDVNAGTGVVHSADRATFCGARPTRGQVHRTTAAHPTSCGCLCELTATGAIDVEVQIDENLTVGAASVPLVPLGEGATAYLPGGDKAVGLTGRELVGITGAGATTPLAGTGRAQTLPDPPWIIFGHEVCGHARLQTAPTRVEHATSEAGDRSAVDVENRIRREHSTVASSLGVRRGNFQARNAAGGFTNHIGGTYQVGSGETLSSIAVKCGIPVANLRDHIWRFNGDQITVATQNTVGTNERLLIEGIDWHEVIRKENMSTIAKMWAVPLASLKRANPQVTGPQFIIRPGDPLLIPAS